MKSRTQLRLDFPLPEERVFRYQAMQDILHHLLNNPFEEFTQKELATITGADVSSISRSVDLLEQLGVLDTDEEKPAGIKVDQDHIIGSNPLFAIPQQEFRKPVQTFLGELIADIEASDDVDELVGVILFGSVARGGADRRSDVDLLVVVEGDLTHGRRIGTKIARNIEEQSFDGERYQFEILVETPESVESHGETLREIFDEGVILERTDALQTVRQAVYGDKQGGK